MKKPKDELMEILKNLWSLGKLAKKEKTVKHASSIILQAHKKQILTWHKQKVLETIGEIKMAEQIFRDHYVPLYHKDKPISEMTSTEQGMYKNILTIVHALVESIKKKLEDLSKEREVKQ